MAIQADMFVDNGCHYTLVGHSEWSNNNDENTLTWLQFEKCS